jgi:hypothetical protein
VEYNIYKPCTDQFIATMLHTFDPWLYNLDIYLLHKSNIRLTVLGFAWN